jgi:hypothetical protein
MCPGKIVGHRRDFCVRLFSLPLLHSLKGNIINGNQASSRHWDSNGQTIRRQEVYGLHQEHVGPLFNQEGKWLGKSTEPGGRERLWNCLSFLSSAETREKGNAIIQRTFEERNRFSPFSHFEFVTATQLLIRYRDELAPASREMLTQLLREALDQQSEIRFLGYNDNFPAMENEVASLAGELLNDAKARNRGLKGMHHLLAMLDRRGMLSEYTSSTYSPVTMLCYSDIAEYSADLETREMALAIERRVWQDIAAHFHPPTNILAGPHSRAYAVDSVGHLHQVQMMLYQTFGNQLWMTPPRFLFPPMAGQVIHHDGDVPFMQVSAVWIASGTYHPTPEIEQLLSKKLFPFRVCATSEFGCAPQDVLIRTRVPGTKPVKTEEVIEYPAGELVSTTYMTEDLAVGSATEQFLDGNQTDAFFVNFRRSPKPRSLEDVSTIYCRYAVDDFGPGLPWTDPRNPGVEATRSLFGESGRMHAVQKDGAVLVPYQAKGEFVGEFTGLRLTIVVPTIYRTIRRILFGNERVHLPFESNATGAVWLEDDFLFACFRPLTVTDHGRPFALRIEEREHYLSVQFINYEGAPRQFSRNDLLHTRNGFVAEIGSPQDSRSFHDFQQKLSEVQITDEVLADQRVVSYRRQNVQLALSYSLTNDRLKYALIDGRLLPRPPFQTAH